MNRVMVETGLLLVEDHQGRCVRRQGAEVNVRTSNVGIITGSGAELVDIMEGRRVDIWFVQETKWKGWKVRDGGWF